MTLAEALERVDAVSPEVGRVIRRELAARTGRTMVTGRLVDDIRQASRYVQDYERELPVNQQGKRRLVRELADRLRGHATELMDI